MNISDQLAQLNRGRFFEDVEEKMADVLQGVQALRKPGTVTITLTFGMEGNEEDQVNVKSKIASKRPMRDPAPTTMFIEEGGLTTKDPKQRDFGEILEVDRETGEIIDAVG